MICQSVRKANAKIEANVQCLNLQVEANVVHVLYILASTLSISVNFRVSVILRQIPFLYILL